LGATPAETLTRIKEIGFDSFFADDTEEKSIFAQKEQAEKLGLDFEFIHGPWRGCNDLWIEGEAYRPLFDDILSTIDLAQKAQVPAVIVHVSSGFKPPEVNDLGLSRFDALVERAEKRGVILAFENLRKLGNLAYLMDRYEDSEFVKNCFDFGHAHCYTPGIPFAEIFGDKLYCTHIHDNFGMPVPKADGDLHLLPFDGNINYADVMRSLDKIGYAGTLTLEVFNFAPYDKMSAEEFIRTAYERLVKLANL
jgi:sugar phosphate isomerase/epimerase